MEFHHVEPYAVGGKPTVDNIQLGCRRHNGYEARVFFAREVDEAKPGQSSPAGSWLDSRRPGAWQAGGSEQAQGPASGSFWNEFARA